MEIHLVFDDPNRIEEHPKCIERSRRDDHTSDNHKHLKFSDDMKIPKKWTEIVNCRQCKRQLIIYMGECILVHVIQLLRKDLKFCVAGSGEGVDRDEVWCVKDDGIELEFKSNAEEADTRVWLHASKFTGKKILIFSPDTDVYHIGLSQSTHNDIIIQLNCIGRAMQMVSMKAFATALCSDPDLACIPVIERQIIIQVVYVASGCDYTIFYRAE